MLGAKAAGGQRRGRDPFPWLARGWETNPAFPLGSHMWTVTHSIVFANLGTRGILTYVILTEYFSLNKSDGDSCGLILIPLILLVFVLGGFF